MQSVSENECVMPSLQEREVQGFHPMFVTIRSKINGSGSGASVAETQKYDSFANFFYVLWNNS